MHRPAYTQRGLPTFPSRRTESGIRVRQTKANSLAIHARTTSRYNSFAARCYYPSLTRFSPSVRTLNEIIIFPSTHISKHLSHMHLPTLTGSGNQPCKDLGRRATSRDTPQRACTQFDSANNLFVVRFGLQFLVL